MAENNFASQKKPQVQRQKLVRNESYATDCRIICPFHEKEVQAFCVTEARLLCVACLIQEKQQHKDHEVLGLPEAAEAERYKLDQALELTDELESKAHGQIQRLNATVLDLEAQSKSKREQATKIFESIR